jgi:hypothetical protein
MKKQFTLRWLRASPGYRSAAYFDIICALCTTKIPQITQSHKSQPLQSLPSSALLCVISVNLRETVSDFATYLLSYTFGLNKDLASKKSYVKQWA